MCRDDQELVGHSTPTYNADDVDPLLIFGTALRAEREGPFVRRPDRLDARLLETLHDERPRLGGSRRPRQAPLHVVGREGLKVFQQPRAVDCGRLCSRSNRRGDRRRDAEHQAKSFSHGPL